MAISAARTHPNVIFLRLDISELRKADCRVVELQLPNAVFNRAGASSPPDRADTARLCSVKLVAAEGAAEVGAAYLLVVDDLFWRAVFEDMAVSDDQGAIANAQGLGDIVVGDKNAFSEFVLEPANFTLEVFDGDGIDAAERFVQEDELGIGDQCPGDFEFSPLAAAEGVGLLISLVGQPVLIQQGLGACECAGGA